MFSYKSVRKRKISPSKVEESGFLYGKFFFKITDKGEDDLLPFNPADVK